jgi:hypothetical protein
MPALPLTPAALASLLDDLERRWTATGAPLRAGSHPDALRDPRPVRLRFGLPRMHSADVRLAFGLGASTSPGIAGDRGASTRPAIAAASYDYGRWEQNTIVRLAMGGATQQTDATGLLMAEGETASRLPDRADGRRVIARQAAIPRATIGSLVVVCESRPVEARSARHAGDARRADDERRSGRGAGGADSALELGLVEAIEQLPDVDDWGMPTQWLVVRPWPGDALPVGVRVGEGAFFEDAWLVRGSGNGGELPCIVMAPGHARGGAHGLLRHGGRDDAIRFVCVLERGPGFERLSVRIEPVRAGG